MNPLSCVFCVKRRVKNVKASFRLTDISGNKWVSFQPWGWVTHSGTQLSVPVLRFIFADGVSSLSSSSSSAVHCREEEVDSLASTSSTHASSSLDNLHFAQLLKIINDSMIIAVIIIFNCQWWFIQKHTNPDLKSLAGANIPSYTV